MDDENTRATTAGFGVALKNLREDRRLSQEKIGRLAGLNRSFVSRLESGDRTPNLRTVERLADALDITAVERCRLIIAAGFVPTEFPAFALRLGTAFLSPERDDLLVDWLRLGERILNERETG